MPLPYCDCMPVAGSFSSVAAPAVVGAGAGRCRYAECRACAPHPRPVDLAHSAPPERPARHRPGYIRRPRERRGIGVDSDVGRVHQYTPACRVECKSERPARPSFDESHGALPASSVRQPRGGSGPRRFGLRGSRHRSASHQSAARARVLKSVSSLAGRNRYRNGMHPD